MAPLENWWLNAVWSVTPTLLLGLMFWLIFRAIFRADRDERRAYAKVEAEERGRRAAQIAPNDQEDA